MAVIANRRGFKQPEPEPSKKARWVILALLLFLFGIGGAWAYWGKDPKIAKIHELREKMADRENTTEEQRRELRGQMRDAMGELSSDQRQTVMNEGRNEWQKREHERMVAYFALSQEDRIKELDARIAADERRRKEWEDRRKERDQQRAQAQANGTATDSAGGSGQGGGPGGQGGGPPGGGGPGGPGGGGPGGGGPFGGPTNSDNPNARRMNMIENVPAQDRSMTLAYRTAMAQRRVELGLPNTSGGGGGRGRPGR